MKIGKIGSLYEIKKFHWMLYPSKEIAATANAPDAHAHADADDYAVYWSKQLNCNVSYIEPNSIFCLLEQTDKVCKILSVEGSMGWIVFPKDEDWAKGCIEEVNIE